MTARPNVLVFGGAGYIGSQTCKALAAEGFCPVVLDDLSEGHRAFVRWGPLLRASILDVEAVNAAYAQHRPVAAIHFAAFAAVGESVSDPAKYWRNNVQGSFAVIDGARRNGNVPLVFSSTCAIYGTPQTTPIREDAAKKPLSPYGQTKLAVERMLDDFGHAYGLPHVALRYFNACGADPDLELGEAHREEAHLIPRAIFAALGLPLPFTVFGTDYPTPDGSAVRDYIHVLDLARAHVLAVKYLLDGSKTAKLNLGTGHGLSVLEIVEHVERLSGRRVPHANGARRAGDPAELIADPRAARRILHFEPRHSSPEQIIGSALAWHERHGHFGVMPNHRAPRPVVSRKSGVPA